MLRILKRNKYEINPEYIKIFAFRNKCPSKFANDLYEIAKKIQEGKNVKNILRNFLGMKIYFNKWEINKIYY